ncbi:hypothetical protein FY526_23120, partial [Clostridioides difficile]
MLEEHVRIASRPAITHQLAHNINKIRSCIDDPLQAEKKAVLIELNTTSKKLQKLEDKLLENLELVPILKSELRKSILNMNNYRKILKLKEDNSTLVDADALYHIPMLIKDKLITLDEEEEKVLLRLM